MFSNHTHLIEGHNLLPRVGTTVHELGRFFGRSARRVHLPVPQKAERESVVLTKHEVHQRLFQEED